MSKKELTQEEKNTKDIKKLKARNTRVFISRLLGSIKVNKK